MDKRNLKILFMGTPDFAVASLKALVEGGYCVVGVVTMPDKPMGRHGSVLQASPVKQYAAAHGLRVLQPERLSDPAFVDELRELDADLQIVVAFRMLPRVVWEMPRLGTFNLHASLLPQYRGAAPINWAVIHGDKETGVTTFFLRHEIDTGDIILQRRVPIAETDDAGTVHDRLMAIGAELVVETVDRIIIGERRKQKTRYKIFDRLLFGRKRKYGVKIIPQTKVLKELHKQRIIDDYRASKPKFTNLGRSVRGSSLGFSAFMRQNLPLKMEVLLRGTQVLPPLRDAPKIFRDTCHIDWCQPTERVYNFIRGLAPYPAAWTEILSADGRRMALKVFRSERIAEPHALSPGAIRTDGRRHLDVATEDGFLRLLDVQPAGKRRMTADQFLNGTDVSACCMA